MEEKDLLQNRCGGIPYPISILNRRTWKGSKQHPFRRQTFFKNDVSWFIKIYLEINSDVKNLLKTHHLHVVNMALTINKHGTCEA